MEIILYDFRMGKIQKLNIDIYTEQVYNIVSPNWTNKK